MSAGIHPAVRSVAAIRARMRATGASGFSFLELCHPRLEPGIVVPRQGDHRSEEDPPLRPGATALRKLGQELGRPVHAGVGEGDLGRNKGRVRPGRRARQACPCGRKIQPDGELEAGLGPLLALAPEDREPLLHVHRDAAAAPQRLGPKDAAAWGPPAHAPSANPAARTRSAGACRSTRSRVSRHSSRGSRAASQYALDAGAPSAGAGHDPGTKPPTRPQPVPSPRNRCRRGEGRPRCRPGPRGRRDRRPGQEEGSRARIGRGVAPPFRDGR